MQILDYQTHKKRFFNAKIQIIYKKIIVYYVQFSFFLFFFPVYLFIYPILHTISLEKTCKN